MGALKCILMAGTLAITVPAEAQSLSQWRPYILEASARHGVPTLWIERVMQAESGGRTHRDGRPIRSSAGAMGLMQLMPGTWADIRAQLGLGHDPDDPRDNILAGTFYLRLLYDRFGYPGLFAAYNAGPARYARHLAGRSALPAETIAYVATVAPPTQDYVRPAPRMTVFAVQKGALLAPQDMMARQQNTSLFVALSQGN